MELSDLPERISSRLSPNPETGCWEWAGGRCNADYAQIRWGEPKGEGKSRQRPKQMVHRVVYELLVGPVPEGHTLDHTCRVRHCCSPEHLEAVLHKENLRRAPNQVTTINAAKTECRNGHPLTGENLYRYPDGRRDCRICRAEAVRRFHEKRKSA